MDYDSLDDDTTHVELIIVIIVQLMLTILKVQVLTNLVVFDYFVSVKFDNLLDYETT